MRPSIDPQSVPPPPKDSSVFSVGTGIGVGLGLLVGAGAGILLGRTWLAPKQSTTTAFPTSSPPATTRLNPGGGLKDAFIQSNNVIDAPGLGKAATWQNDDCWGALFRLSPSERASILWQCFAEEWDAGRFVLAEKERAQLEYQLELLRAHAYAQQCNSLWPSEHDVMERLDTVRALIGRGSAMERVICQKVVTFASGGTTSLYNFRFDCSPGATPAPPAATAYPSSTGSPAYTYPPGYTVPPPPIASPVPNIILTDFDACQRAFAALTIAQQGWVANEMLREFGRTDYVQVEGDIAMGARLREVSQAARAKVGSTTLQPKFVNARLRALRVALSAAGQDRRDWFCQLVANAPRGFNPGGALDPLGMSFPLRR